MRIERSSHVEPDDQGRWWAEVIDGPKMGPFPLRSEALAAEVAWLLKHRLKADSKKKAERCKRFRKFPFAFLPRAALLLTLGFLLAMNLERTPMTTRQLHRAISRAT